MLLIIMIFFRYKNNIGQCRKRKSCWKTVFRLKHVYKKKVYIYDEIRNEKRGKKRGKFPGATRWPHDTIFLLVKVAIRAAVVSLYNANAASVHNVATRRDCGRGVERAPFTGNNIYNIHIIYIYITHAHHTT